MPDFESFELSHRAVHPFLLTIGAYILSFGPFILVLFIGFYFVVSSATAEMDAFRAHVEKIPGTPYYNTQRTVEQSEQVKVVLGDTGHQQRNRVAEAESVLPGETTDRQGEGEVLDKELSAGAQASQRKNIDAAIGRTTEAAPKEADAMLQAFLNLPAPLVMVGAIFFLLGLFYFPVAISVAGNTKSFSAMVNPFRGPDTIKRLEGRYFEALLMGTAIVIASIVVGTLAGAILSPVDLPGVRNLPSPAIGVLFSFILWAILSCVLGHALYKKTGTLDPDPV